MPQLNFKVSDNQKFDFLWTLLNANYNEENGWIIEYGICDIYDEYAIVRNYAEATFERVYYTKNDETDSLEITKRERCFIVDVNETEKAALAAIQALNEGTYENLDTKFAKISELEAQISEFGIKIDELNTEISTLNTEKEQVQGLYDAANNSVTEYEAKINDLNEQIGTLTNERDELATYKKTVEDNAKKAVISGYADVLSADIIDNYMNNLDSYTCEELDMRLTYEQKKTNPSTFSNQSQNTNPGYVPKDSTPAGGWTSILSKYEK